QVMSIDALVSDITTSSREQAVGLAEVNGAVTNMDQVTQRNAAMVQETTAACHALNNETTRLTELMSKFKVSQAASNDMGATSPAVAAPRAPANAAPAPATAASAPAASNPVHAQQQRAQEFFAAGATAQKIEPDFDAEQDWTEF
ncbi:MAG: hypothetical protein WBA35_06900, partial [Litorimonas sp.]